MKITKCSNSAEFVNEVTKLVQAETSEWHGHTVKLNEEPITPQNLKKFLENNYVFWVAKFKDESNTEIAPSLEKLAQKITEELPEAQQFTKEFNGPQLPTDLIIRVLGRVDLETREEVNNFFDKVAKTTAPDSKTQKKTGLAAEKSGKKLSHEARVERINVNKLSFDVEITNSKGLYGFQSTEELVKTIEKSKRIECLKIVNYEISPTEFERIIKACPNLIELQFDGRKLDLEKLNLLKDKLPHLKKISLLACDKLKDFPDFPKELTHLEIYQAAFNNWIVPDGLIDLKISNCPLPNKFPQSLRSLGLSFLSSATLPDLPNSLIRLNISYCANLDIEHLVVPTNLEFFGLYYNEKLVELPKQLNNLRELNIRDCNNLKSLPTLPITLEKLTLHFLDESLFVLPPYPKSSRS